MTGRRKITPGRTRDVGRAVQTKLVKAASRSTFLGVRRRATVIESRPDTKRERRNARLALRRRDEL